MLIGMAVEIPAASQGRKSVYLKLKERQAFDFAVVSVAVRLALKGSTVTDSRVVFAGLAPFPTRSVKAESALKGMELKSAVTAVTTLRRSRTRGVRVGGHS
jgi:xanthine dehydrogenase YagS FAD-binding subunit